MKIVYCTDSICYEGGLQRVTLIKANALAEIETNKVYIIVTDNKKKPLIPLNNRIQLIDLEINYFEDDYKSKINILKGIIIKRYTHKKRLTIILNRIKPDIIISTGTSEKNFLGKIKIQSNPIKLREIHMPKNYRLISANNTFEKLIAFGGNFFDYKINIKHYNKIIVLTKEDHIRNWKNSSKVEVIPNPFTPISINSSEGKREKRIITAGRLVHIKNFSSLINAWNKIHHLHPEWKLEIYGEGALKKELQNQIKDLNLKKSVQLKGHSNNIYNEMSKASIFALTSISEGFGLVIVEAMACGLPVVSYACPCGPKDIITEGKDGFLVEVNDEVTLANRINILIENENLRKRMSEEAQIKAKQYKIENITSMWMDLFQILTK